MIVDNCVGEKNPSDPGEQIKQCRQFKNSTDLSGQLDTRGSPMQLGDHPDDVSFPGGNFSGCVKNLRINSEVMLKLLGIFCFFFFNRAYYRFLNS